MFTNINSDYILKLIFSLINDVLKLQIIIYNKKLQAKLDIDINYYRILSENVEVYKNFKTEYLNKKKNGKGIEYFFGKKIYEGEFKNGKRHGYGKLYDSFFNVLEYEGEFKDGKIHGYGKEYDLNSNLEFEGEYLCGKRWNGIVIHRHKNKKILFEGEYKNGKLWSGKGYKIYNNEIDYEIINGNGKFKKYNDILNHVSFESNMINGEITGYTKKYRLKRGLEFEGEYKNGKKMVKVKNIIQMVI